MFGTPYIILADKDSGFTCAEVVRFRNEQYITLQPDFTGRHQSLRSTKGGVGILKALRYRLKIRARINKLRLAGLAGGKSGRPKQATLRKVPGPDPTLGVDLEKSGWRSGKCRIEMGGANSSDVP